MQKEDCPNLSLVSAFSWECCGAWLTISRGCGVEGSSRSSSVPSAEMDVQLVVPHVHPPLHPASGKESGLETSLQVEEAQGTWKLRMFCSLDPRPRLRTPSVPPGPLEPDHSLRGSCPAPYPGLHPLESSNTLLAVTTPTIPRLCPLSPGVNRPQMRTQVRLQRPGHTQEHSLAGFKARCPVLVLRLQEPRGSFTAVPLGLHCLTRNCYLPCLLCR